jgi:hypothetical protein
VAGRPSVGSPCSLAGTACSENFGSSSPRVDIYWFLTSSTIPSLQACPPRIHTWVLENMTTNSNYQKKITEKEAAGDRTKTLQKVNDNLASHMPEEYLDVVHHSDLNNLSWAPLLYWSGCSWDCNCGPGNAFHPMTSDIAQGGCSALHWRMLSFWLVAWPRMWRVTWWFLGPTYNDVILYRFNCGD